MPSEPMTKEQAMKYLRVRRRELEGETKRTDVFHPAEISDMQQELAALDLALSALAAPPATVGEVATFYDALREAMPCAGEARCEASSPCECANAALRLLESFRAAAIAEGRRLAGEAVEALPNMVAPEPRADADGKVTRWGVGVIVSRDAAIRAARGA